MTPCPSKRSPINGVQPPRLCYATCARYEYAVHLSGRDWIAPKVSGGVCVNHVQSIDGERRNSTHPQGGQHK
jgi:hypothetical protein